MDTETDREKDKMKRHREKITTYNQPPDRTSIVLSRLAADFVRATLGN